jgi:hypothetical protein
MATQTKTDPTIAEVFDVEAAVTRWRAATSDYLNVYEKSVEQFADTEVKAAQAVTLPLVSTLVKTHADLSRKLAGAYVSAARDLLNA